MEICARVWLKCLLFICFVLPAGFLQLSKCINVCRDKCQLFLILKNDAIQGAGYVGQNDITWGQASSTGIPPDQKNKQS
jgi:hypothetical protein